MSWEFFVGRKFLSQEWGKDLEKYIARDWPVLCEYFQKPEGPRLQPPRRKGLDEKGLFQVFEYSHWRKTFKKALHATSKNVRGAFEGDQGVPQECSAFCPTLAKCIRKALLEEGLQRDPEQARASVPWA